MSDDPGGDARTETPQEESETSDHEDGEQSDRGQTVVSEDGKPEDEDPSLEELRERVEEKYDFDDFTPADMAEMDAEEWQAAFDPETWITGTALLDRVEADLKRKVVDRQIFAMVERVRADEEDRVVAYSDAGYAVVHDDGTVEGNGMVLREVKPLVALCSMEDYEAGPMPEDDDLLPDPSDVTTESSRLGDTLVQAVAATQVLAGLALLLSPLVLDLGGNGSAILTTVVGLAFILIGVFLFVLVANARLSGRFRAAEYRDRLEAIGAGSESRPEFVPIEDDASDSEE